MQKKVRKRPSGKNTFDIQQYTKELLRKKQKFYLVGITGRTSFILQNLKGIKFKITIGNEIKCSCSSTQSLYHCIHTLYVLTQIFSLLEDSPLLLQSKYDDKQLRHIIANRRIYSNKIRDFLKFIPMKKSQQMSPSNKDPNVIMQEDDQDDMQNLCAICHMQIVKSDAITSCTTVCRNNFHLQCFSQWMKYQLKNNGTVKCPLCRDQKSEESLLQIKLKEYEIKEQIVSKKVGKQFNYYCDGCMLKEIEENRAVYKCVCCQDVTLCETCFNYGKHIKHPFICKLANQKKWKQCQDRKIKKKIDQEQGLIRMKLPNYKKLSNFLATTYPTFFSKNNRWNVVECKKLDIKLEQLQCMMCSDPQKSFLRKLPCGHFIHHKCLRKRVQKGKLYCKHQGVKFLAGYESLLKQEQLNRKAEFENNQQQCEEEQQENLQKSGGLDCSPSYFEKTLKNSKTLKSLTNNNSNSSSCDSRRKKYRGEGSRSKDERNRSLVNKFNSSMRIS